MADRLSIIRVLLVYQFGACMVVAMLGLIHSPIAAKSALLGGLICLIPNACFAYRMFRYRGARAARQILRSFYSGEAVKLALTAALFAVVFAGVKPINALALFLGYGAVHLMSWVVPLVFGQVKSG